MQSIDQLPTEMRSTAQLILCAYPQGILEDEYLMLLYLLHKHMSDRVLADCLTFFINKSAFAVLHDIYSIASDSPDDNVLAPVYKRLIDCGFEDWIREA